MMLKFATPVLVSSLYCSTLKYAQYSMSCVEFPQITHVRAYTTESPTKALTAAQGADCHDVEDQHWINGAHTPIATPMSVFSKYRHNRKSWGINALGTMVVEVETEDGTCGHGVTIAGEPGCYIVEKHLSRFVEGQDPRNIELMWEQMFRGTLNYGRKGLPLQAVSAVDLALWDLLGRLRREPVWALLGGRTRDRLPVYSTTARPDLAQTLGFVGAKVPVPYGPASGDEGLQKNVEFLSRWRESVGPDFPLMLDCYMSLTVPYTVRLVNQLDRKGVNIKWIEEYLHPDDYEGYSQVRQALQGRNCMLTTGEHEYSRYGFQQLLEKKCVDILQPDVTWMGGITEARRIVAMAASKDVYVIPHGSSVYSYHMQYAFNNTPLAEYINLSPKADKIVPYFGGLFTDEPLPKNGHIDLPDKPGFGLTINRDCLTRPYERPGSKSKNKTTSTNDNSEENRPIMPF